MKIFTSITVDMNRPNGDGTFAVISSESFEYFGPVAKAKEDTSAKATEVGQKNFASQLMSAFGSQFGAQSSILSFLNNKLQNIVSNPTGYSPQALAALNTQNTQGTAADYAKAQQATNAANATKGNGLPSGVTAQLNAGNANAAAGEESQGQTNIAIANENQKQSNFWNAIQGLQGTASQYNPTGYAGAETGAANSVGDLSKAVSESQQTGFTNAFGNAFAGSLGSGLASGLTGGMAKKTEF